MFVFALAFFPALAGAEPSATSLDSVCDRYPPFLPVFRFGTGSAPVAAPTVADDGSVYIGTSEGYLHAMGADGSYRWGYTLKGPATGRPALGAAGAILVPTARRIYAIRPDGSLLWVFQSPIRVLGDLIRDDLGRFHFASDDGRVFALSGRGALVAHVPGRVPLAVLPVALPGGALAAARQDGSVLLVRAGKSLRFELGGVANGLFACPKRDLCAIVGGKLEGLGAGTQNFQVPALRGAATEERLALISSEQQLELYDASAEHLATVALPDAASAAPAVDALGRVFVPLKRGALLALSRSGAPLGCMQVGHSPLGSPVLDAARRRVLVTAREGVLAAFEVP